MSHFTAWVAVQKYNSRKTLAAWLTIQTLPKAPAILLGRWLAIILGGWLANEEAVVIVSSRKGTVTSTSMAVISFGAEIKIYAGY